MTREELTMVFGESIAKVYSPESRQKAADKLRREQHFGNSPNDEQLLAINVELALNRQLFHEVLERILCRKA